MIMKKAYYNGKEITSVAYQKGLDLSFYEDMDKIIQDGLFKALEIEREWDSSITSLTGYLQDRTEILFMPMVDTGNVTIWNSAFGSCEHLLTIPELDTSKATNMNLCFHGCSSLRSIPMMDTKNVTNMYGTFMGCASLLTIPELDTSNVTSMGYCFYGCFNLETIPALNTEKVESFLGFLDGCLYLKRIEGLSFKSATGVNLITTDKDNSGYRGGIGIVVAYIKDIGYQSACKELDFSMFLQWGDIYGGMTDGVIRYSDAKESLLYTLLENSFDRLSAGYPECNITLSTKTKSLLSSSEISQIELKGYNIL